MPFLSLLAKVRKDPMGPATMRLLKSNADWARTAVTIEHMTTGEHNAREVPRVVRRISGTTVSPASTDITSVTNPATGTYVLTLATSRFSPDWMTAQINVCDSDVANKPYSAHYEVVSATELRVYIKKLSSALGYEPAGNTWVAANAAFDIAIHSETLATGSFANALPSSIFGDPLKPTRWNALVQASADLYKLMDAEHDTDGTHTTRQVAAYSGMWRYNGSSVSLDAGTAVDLSVSRSSAGVYAVSSVKTLTTETHGFLAPDTPRSNGGDGLEVFLMHCRQTSTTAFTVYVYKFNRATKVWDRADGDFWLALHKGY